jgi:hypothetical protein
MGQYEIIPGWLKNNNTPLQSELDYAQTVAGNDWITGDPNPYMAGDFAIANIPGIVIDLVEKICPGILPNCPSGCVPAIVSGTPMCECTDLVEPVIEDLLTFIPFQLENTTYFQDVSWTVSYDPKAKAWISFHDWHPELTFNSINHFMTSKTRTTSTPQCPPGYSYGINGSDECCITVGDSILANVNIQFTPADVTGTIGSYICECPFGYEQVPASQPCDPLNPPICKRVACNCDNVPVLDPSLADITMSGTCDDVVLAGTPGYVNTDPVICTWEYKECVVPNYEVGGIWKHNVRNDLYANYYGDNYPWEVTLIQNTGQVVNTLRSIEYQQESYVYKNFNLPRPQELIGTDRFHDLDWNFDEAIIYNSEQVSGLLTLDLTPKNNVILLNDYPIINNPTDIRILYSKEEQKYRFNQFWDITDDRGEFTGAERPIWLTTLNGYIKNLNQANLNYIKAPLQRKKFRHYYNMIILRKNVSGDRKMLLKLNNSKMNISFR